MIGSRSCVGGFIHFLCSNSILIMNIVFGKFLKLNRLSYRQFWITKYTVFESARRYFVFGQIHRKCIPDMTFYFVASRNTIRRLVYELWWTMDMPFHKLSSDWLTLTQDQQPTRTEWAPPMKSLDFLSLTLSLGWIWLPINLSRIML